MVATLADTLVPDTDGLFIFLLGCCGIALLMLFLLVQRLKELNRQLRRFRPTDGPVVLPTPEVADPANAPAPRPAIFSDDGAGYIRLREGVPIAGAVRAITDSESVS
jgi:hypothetical protein